MHRELSNVDGIVALLALGILEFKAATSNRYHERLCGLQLEQVCVLRCQEGAYVSSLLFLRRPILSNDIRDPDVPFLDGTVELVKFEA